MLPTKEAACRAEQAVRRRWQRHIVGEGGARFGDVSSGGSREVQEVGDALACRMVDPTLAAVPASFSSFKISGQRRAAAGAVAAAAFLSAGRRRKRVRALVGGYGRRQMCSLLGERGIGVARNSTVGACQAVEAGRRPEGSGSRRNSRSSAAVSRRGEGAGAGGSGKPSTRGEGGQGAGAGARGQGADEPIRGLGGCGGAACAICAGAAGRLSS